MVYRESDEYYAEVFSRGEKLFEEASDALGFETKKKTEGRAELFALNTSPWPRTEIVKVPEGVDVTGAQSGKDGKYVVLGAGEGFGVASAVKPEGVSKGRPSRLMSKMLGRRC